jgi:hypothetical protein
MNFLSALLSPKVNIFMTKNEIEKALISPSEFSSVICRSAERKHIKDNMKIVSEYPLWFGSLRTAQKYSRNSAYNTYTGNRPHYLRSLVPEERKSTKRVRDDNMTNEIKEYMKSREGDIRDLVCYKMRDKMANNKPLYLLNLSDMTKTIGNNPNNHPLNMRLLDLIMPLIEDEIKSDDFDPNLTYDMMQGIYKSYGYDDKSGIRDSTMIDDLNFTLYLNGVLDNMFVDKTIIGYCHSPNLHFHEEVAIFGDFVTDTKHQYIYPLGHYQLDPVYGYSIKKTRRGGRCKKRKQTRKRRERSERKHTKK